MLYPAELRAHVPMINQNHSKRHSIFPWSLSTKPEGNGSGIMKARWFVVEGLGSQFDLLRNSQSRAPRKRPCLVPRIRPVIAKKLSGIQRIVGALLTPQFEEAI